jgi:hypothetical protein
MTAELYTHPHIQTLQGQIPGIFLVIFQSHMRVASVNQNTATIAGLLQVSGLLRYICFFSLSAGPTPSGGSGMPIPITLRADFCTKLLSDY